MAQCGLCNLYTFGAETTEVWTPVGYLDAHRECADFFTGSRPPVEERQRRDAEGCGGSGQE